MLKLVTAVFLNLVCVVAFAQVPNPGNISAAKYDLIERRGVVVAMRDGVRLSADIYTPDAAQKWPAILNILPYNRGIVREDARWYAKRGYVVVVVDSRGTYNSEGSFDPFDPKHKTDGYDLVEWIAHQPWSSGKVGMMGASYGGWTQWWTASTAPPHLVAIAPEGAPPDGFENVPYQNGALVGWIQDWAAMMSGRTLQLTGDGRYGGWGEHRLQDYEHTPYIDINPHRGLESAPWLPQWYQQNKSTDPYWTAIAYQGEAHYSKMTVPSLAFTGWFDVDYPGSPMNYTGMKKFGATPEARHPKLIIGPWTHVNYKREISGVDFGPEAAFDTHGYIVRWFDHFLKGIDNGVETDPPVYVFVMGENRWHAEQDWPLPQAVPTKYYLASGGHANSLNGDGVLTIVAPRKQAVDRYVYDPKTPTLDPYNGFAGSTGGIDAALDTRNSASGNEVLVYQTPPLPSPVEVTGPIVATLYAATSARDTDWMIRLVDVQPDGRPMLLTEGVIRARNRDPAHEGRFNAAQLSSIEPNHVYPYTIDFWRGTGNLFQQGHRIRIEISSSWFPYHLPNLNTGADNLALVSMTDAVIARQTIYHGSKYPSNVVLPIVPVRTVPSP